MDDVPGRLTVAASAEAGARIARRANVWVLSVAQGLFTAAIAIDLTLTGLTGYQLAPDKSLATLPFALITVAGAVVTLLASYLMQRIGRRWGFALGALTCAVGGLVSTWAVLNDNFWLFCLGTAAVGVFQAFAQYYRLAAADSVPQAEKARAISLVLGGGVVAAVLGPALAGWSKDMFPIPFAGSYLMVFVLGLVSAVLLAVAYTDMEINEASHAADDLPARPLATVFIQPISMAAIANNVIGGMVMMILMTAAPLAVVACRHSIDDGASVIQWHLVGMYAPSLFAGYFIQRFGMPMMLFSGMALTLACSLVAMVSTSLVAFYVALLSLGVGWNFMFVGGSTLLASSYRPSERPKVQGWAEMIRYVFTAAGALAAGPVLERFGWEDLNAFVIPLVLVAAVMTFVWVKSEKAVGVQAS